MFYEPEKSVRRAHARNTRIRPPFAFNIWRFTKSSTTSPLIFPRRKKRTRTTAPSRCGPITIFRFNHRPFFPSRAHTRHAPPIRTVRVSLTRGNGVAGGGRGELRHALARRAVAHASRARNATREKRVTARRESPACI